MRKICLCVVVAVLMSGCMGWSRTPSRPMIQMHQNSELERICAAKFPGGQWSSRVKEYDLTSAEFRDELATRIANWDSKNASNLGDEQNATQSAYDASAPLDRQRLENFGFDCGFFSSKCDAKIVLEYPSYAGYLWWEYSPLREKYIFKIDHEKGTQSLEITKD